MMMMSNILKGGTVNFYLYGSKISLQIIEFSDIPRVAKVELPLLGDNHWMFFCCQQIIILKQFSV